LCGKVSFESEETQEIISAMSVLSKVAGQRAKHIRKDWDSIGCDEQRTAREHIVKSGFSKELGDCLWMISNIAHHNGTLLENVCNENILKLEDRKNRNVIIGEGDNR